MILKNEQGYALPLVLVIMFALVLLSTAFWHFGVAETKQVSHQEDKAKAHYLARSGMGVTENVLTESTETLLVNNEDDFYLHGSLDDDTNNSLVWELNFGKYNGEYDENDIVVEVEWDGFGDGYGEGTIISTGNFRDVKEKIERDFEFYTGIDGDTANWMSPGKAHEGRIRSGTGLDEWEVPVSFTNENEDEDGVYVKDESPGTFSAPVISFIDEKDSLLIKHQNPRPIFEANYISFYGNIVFEREGNVYIQVRDEEVFYMGKRL